MFYDPVLICLKKDRRVNSGIQKKKREIQDDKIVSTCLE
jgi:hypothetical protein